MEKLLTSLVRLGLGLEKDPGSCVSSLVSLTPAQWEEIWEWSSRQQLWGVVAQGVEKIPGACPPAQIAQSFADRERELALQFYSILSLTTWVLDLLGREGVFVLKGVTLSPLYPREEMRKIGDLDLYIPQETRRKEAQKILEEQGFSRDPQVGSHHITYHKKWGDGSFCLELHDRPAGRMGMGRKQEQEVERKFAALRQWDRSTPAGQEVPGLPVTWAAFHLLLHMMNHFLGGEYQLGMLCDWTLFWEKRYKEVDRKLLRQLLEESGTLGLARMVSGICEEHLGLAEEKMAWLGQDGTLQERQERLYSRLIQGSRRKEGKLTVVLDPHGSLLGQMAWATHQQMIRRFPTGSKHRLLWPALWIATLGIFLRNNRTLGRGSLRTVVDAARQQGEQLEELALTK